MARESRERTGFTTFPSFLCSQDIEVFPVSVHFVPHLAAAVNASVFVLVTVGQNEEEKFPHRHSSPTLETVKLRGFELLELSLLLLPRLFRNIW
jgi:hypothetical protein